MQWGHIKTLFILSFLILNVYLLIQFVDKQSDYDHGILNNQETTIEDRLATENITIKPDLNTEITEESYMLASQKEFSQKERKEIHDRDDQNTLLIDNHLLISQLEEPITIPKDASSEEISQLVRSYLFFPDKFMFWEWNKELNILIFFQKLENRPVYFNENGPGMLIVYLNEDNEVTYYTQMMLGEVEAQGSSAKQLIQPIQAIELLFDQNRLIHNDEITNVSMGYYSRLIEEGEQVFAPTWNITVNGERHYFVNAIEGFIFSDIGEMFLNEVMEETITKVETLDDEEDIYEDFLEILLEKQPTEKTE